MGDDGAAMVELIRIGGADADGREVIDVYGRQSGRYAIYQTTGRVVVRYADDPLLQRLQRKRLAGLAPVRNAIDGSLLAWRCRDPKWSRLPQTAREFDMRIASGLIEAIEGNLEGGLAILQQIQADLAGEMGARARLSYLVWTLASAAAFLIPMLLFYLGVRNGAWGNGGWIEGALAVVRAIVAGVLGAVYSIALGISRRDLKSDLRRYDYFTDSFVRVGIGAIAAFVLACFVLSGIIQIGFGAEMMLPDGDRSVGRIYLPIWPVGLIVGFLAGFAERLVPDLLDSYAVKARKADPVPAAEAKPTGAANRSAAGTAAPDTAEEIPVPEDEDLIVTPPSDEETIDSCDVDLADPQDATPDDKLPAAAGGVVGS
ncbi:hypothetical protein [Novosphingobium sp. 9U]|uniref:hypothetical protein n=1 Tax=Novosphingobium sp. 9U TaxID=2653158 RepID=UPI0012F37CC2|nr:hypothetical protein [Novosphingobium sp. 9U]VWX54613.1 conserved membrane hypothetical protein [Novosphingobium sp. 9U]